MARPKTSRVRRQTRHVRVRRRVSGSADRPRLCVFRSLNHVYAQVIDDSKGITLAAASSLDPEIRQQRDGKPKSQISNMVGTLIAERAKGRGVSAVVFDRGGHKFHGRTKALADAAREGGLVF